MNLIKALEKFSPNEGVNLTPIPGVVLTKFSKEDRRSKRHWRACFAVVLQGCKEVVLGTQVFKCEVSHYTATPLALPVVSRISKAPFLAILIELDPVILSSVAAQIDAELIRENKNPARAFFTGVATEKIQDAVTRLVALFKSPEEARVLGPLLIRELFYYLLKGPEGIAIRQFVQSGSTMHKIAQAVHTIQTDLVEEIDVSELAKSAHMSRSSFFANFSDVTSMSPIQYQKKLRLLEAKRLMIFEDESAEGAALSVGYKSASQFNREYSRMFGLSPLRDVMKFKSKEGP